MRTFNDKMTELLGQKVVVEGVFPVPIQGEIFYSPAVGTLKEVLEDGFVLTNELGHEINYLKVTIRSVGKAHGGGMVLPKTGVISA